MYSRHTCIQIDTHGDLERHLVVPCLETLRVLVCLGKVQKWIRFFAHVWRISFGLN
jgi:hypothetical protein